MTPNVYYDCNQGTKWESNGTQWIMTGNGLSCSDLSLIATFGVEQTTESQIKRVSRRRKQSNRMFTIKNGPGPDVATSEDAKPILGDNYTVTGREYPFGGKIEE